LFEVNRMTQTIQCFTFIIHWCNTARQHKPMFTEKMSHHRHHHSAACHRRARQLSTCHEYISADRSCAVDKPIIQWSLVVFNGSKLRLSGPANPPSPVSSRSQNASLESLVSEEVKRKLPARNTTVYSSYTNPERHNAHCYRRTGRSTYP